MNIPASEADQSLPRLPVHKNPYLHTACTGAGSRAVRVGRQMTVQRTPEAWTAVLICPRCQASVEVSGEKQNHGSMPRHDRPDDHTYCPGDLLAPAQVRVFPQRSQGAGDFDELDTNQKPNRRGKRAAWAVAAASALLIGVVLTLSTGGGPATTAESPYERADTSVTDRTLALAPLPSATPTRPGIESSNDAYDENGNPVKDVPPSTGGGITGTGGGITGSDGSNDYDNFTSLEAAWRMQSPIARQNICLNISGSSSRLAAQTGLPYDDIRYFLTFQCNL